jgi:hypothetical protein
MTRHILSKINVDTSLFEKKTTERRMMKEGMKKGMNKIMRRVMEE